MKYGACKSNSPQPQPIPKLFQHALFAEMAFIMNDYTEQAHVY